eukprot:Skav202127  [mRNA]  locus=scaffold1980:249145:249688:- [translate_table: standard]
MISASSLDFSFKLAFTKVASESIDLTATRRLQLIRPKAWNLARLSTFSDISDEATTDSSQTVPSSSKELPKYDPLAYSDTSGASVASGGVLSVLRT